MWQSSESELGILHVKSTMKKYEWKSTHMYLIVTSPKPPIGLEHNLKWLLLYSVYYWKHRLHGML